MNDDVLDEIIAAWRELSAADIEAAYEYDSRLPVGISKHVRSQIKARARVYRTAEYVRLDTIERDWRWRAAE